MNLLHSITSRLHSLERLVVDIRRFDRVNLLLELHDLRRGLLKVLLMLMFPSQRSFGGCKYQENPCISPYRPQNSTRMRYLQSLDLRGSGGELYRSYLWRRVSVLRRLAPRFDSQGASRASAASPAELGGRGWRSWGHPSASERRRRRTRTTCLVDEMRFALVRSSRWVCGWCLFELIRQHW
jgi:hypothetical protein